MNDSVPAHRRGDGPLLPAPADARRPLVADVGASADEDERRALL